MRKFYFRTLGKKVGVRIDENILDPRVGKVTAVDDGEKIDLWITMEFCQTWFDMRRQKKDWHNRGFYKCFVDKRLAVYVDPDAAEAVCAIRIEKCVDNALECAVGRVFFALQAELNIMMLHASSVEREGKAYLFIAPSGGGKTTLSKRMEQSGYKLLSEECSPVSFSGGKFLTGSQPSFLGADKEKNYEVAGMYILEKAEDDSIGPIPVNEAIAKAFPETMVHFFDLVPEEAKKRSREKNFFFLEKAFNSVAFGRFRFAREGAVNICV